MNVKLYLHSVIQNVIHEMTINVQGFNPKNGFTRIYFFIRIAGELVPIPSKIKVLTESWDNVKKRITSPQSDYKGLNDLLTKRKALLKSVFDDLERDGIAITKEGVRARFEQKISGKKVDPVVINAVTVADLLFKYEKDYKSTLKIGYLRKFGTFARHLIIWAKKGNDITAANFNLATLNRYINEYLVDELELANNSIHDHVRKIRLVMEVERDTPVHPEHAKFFWKYLKVKPVWLMWSEVEKLEKCKCTEEDQVYRDEFLFRCYTGLRWSDANQLLPHHFIKTKKGIELDFTAIKTVANQNILLSSAAAAMVKRWGYKVPKLRIDECNARIKQICRAAGIKDLKEKVKISGSNRTVELLPKWKWVTTHVARRTFGRRWAELSVEKLGAVDFFKLMKYYGHSQVQQTIDYIGWETEEVNNEMRRLFG